MAAEVWVRNPEYCIRELVEVGHLNLAWDRGYLVKRHIDPIKWAALHIGPTLPFRTLAIGDQGTAELAPGHSLDSPVAVYPTWEYGHQEPDLLEEYMARPVGLSETLCGDTRTPIDERPVLGQDHRVVVIRPPDLRSGMGRGFLRWITGLIEDYPDANVHLHGFYSYRSAFGHNFTSVDIEPRISARGGHVMLPHGKEVPWEKTTRMSQWVEVCGMRPADLEVPRNRCMFNVRSALWAAQHYKDNLRFKVRGIDDPDITSAVAPPKPVTISTKTKLMPVVAGDKITCDTCSLSVTCKYSRDGSVCSLPGSDPAPLARYFKTRDSDVIIQGLGEVLAVQAERLRDGRADELLDGELDPEVTKIANSMMSGGVKLAKLVNPALAAAGASRTQVNIGVVGGAPSPNSLMAATVAELEAQGFTRDQITPELIAKCLGTPVAIEAHASDR